MGNPHLSETGESGLYDPSYNHRYGILGILWNGKDEEQFKERRNAEKPCRTGIEKTRASWA
jgi:hypothetical protein